MKLKLNADERRWVGYDVGNSAFTLLVSTIVPIYFYLIAADGGVSSSDYLAYYGYATSAATLIVALLGPTLGSLSDLNGVRRKIFSVAVLFGAVGCIVMSFISSWLWFLILFVLAKSAYSVSLVVYDSMLTDITTEERMDEVSSRGYAWGYIGSCIPFLIALIPVLLANSDMLSMYVAMPIAFTVVAIWWVAFSVPLWKNYRQTHFVEGGTHPVRTGFVNLGKTFKDVWKDKKVLLFLVAFFFYIDGVYTIIDMATSYGTSLGLDTVMLLIALLVTQVVAFPSAILLGMLSRKVKMEYIIGACIIAYLAISVYAIFLVKVYQFWILAICVGLFQGTVQALSRSYFAKIIPAEKSGEYFGLYDVFGKGAAFVGTLLVSIVTQATGDQHYGVGSLAAMFLLGFIFFIFAVHCKSRVSEEPKEAGNQEEAEEAVEAVETAEIAEIKEAE